MAEGEEQDDSQKTEDPTPKKIEEARKRGQVALSREMNNWVMILAGTLMVGVFAGPVMSNLMTVMRTFIERPYDFPSMPGGLTIVLGGVAWEVMKILFMPLLLLMAAAFLAPFLQVGPLIAPEVIRPDISKISPIKGFQRLFSMRSIVEFVKGVLKIVVVGAICTIIIYPYFDRFEHFIDLDTITALGELQFLVMRMLIGILILMLVIAVMDLLYQRYEYYRKMRMTKQELKDEYKQTEGDPMVKGRLRQLRAQKARQRMMQAVPTADVVITNPTHFSVALKYDPGEMSAPVCVAKGVDDLALRIREVAKEHDIVVFENPPLARILFDTVEVDDTIPAEHFKAVAEVISYVYRIKGRPLA
ncbi:MAG: flagellar biosynthesis protein FlhB [Rhodospirillales bacterium]|nr:flagellar biosynthesis protein FlhB [Alphaproteobacteria bacterium]MCB1839257.1 flagellar biosynthesis protein FlhB [Alphaproteobacteria bacterium]MCB9976181.1 flagellar biosynthesis protein FlhB [Rhodospirillales bacterium]